MTENPKYPVSDLTDEDKKQLDGVIIKIAVSYNSLRTKYPLCRKRDFKMS